LLQILRGSRFPVAAARACVAALVLASAGLAAAQALLADAPVRVEPQDARDWTMRARSTLTRDGVAALYNGTYSAGSSVPLQWTGSTAGCDPGTTSLAHQQAVIDRINYFRALVDLPAVSLLSGTTTTQMQAAALMMAANNALSHAPPASWLCYSADGGAGASSANLALGAQGVDAIDLYMEDGGAGNAAAGHRRWILFPPRASMSTGDVGGGATPSNALYVFGPQGARPATVNGVAWPPDGWVPYQNLPSFSNRWSLSYPGADFANATVAMTGPAGAISVTLEPVATGYGDNTIVFRPTGFDYATPAADTTYIVDVNGIAGAGVPASIRYSVTVIDPSVAGAGGGAAATVTVVEYYNASLDHYFATWSADEIALLDAGATSKGWTRTGQSFKAFAAAPAGATDLCRIYIGPARGDSHFFGRNAKECNDTMAAHPDFTLESSAIMAMYVPVAGACPAGTVPVYRVFSNRADANHRYTTDAALRDAMVSRGWIAEGDGADRVVLCAPA
jgi:uncharacterized protein YkwD